MKYSKLWYIILSIVVFSCATDNHEEEDDSVLQLQEIGEEYIQHFNTHNWEKLALLFAPSVDVAMFPAGDNRVTVTNVDLVSMLQDLERAYPDFRYDVVARHPSANTLIFELYAHGVSPTGDTLSESTCKVLEFDDKMLIKREYNYE